MDYRRKCKMQKHLEDNIGETLMTLRVVMTFKIKYQACDSRNKELIS